MEVRDEEQSGFYDRLEPDGDQGDPDAVAEGKGDPAED
jgi:hypothetical protein